MISPDKLRKLQAAKKDLASFLTPRIVNPEGEAVGIGLGGRRSMAIDTTTYLAKVILNARQMRRGNAHWDKVTENTWTERGPKGGLRALRFRRINEGVILPEDLVPDPSLRERIVAGFEERGIRTEIQKGSVPADQE